MLGAPSPPSASSWLGNMTLVVAAATTRHLLALAETIVAMEGLGATSKEAVSMSHLQRQARVLSLCWAGPPIEEKRRGRQRPRTAQ